MLLCIRNQSCTLDDGTVPLAVRLVLSSLARSLEEKGALIGLFRVLDTNDIMKHTSSATLMVIPPSDNINDVKRMKKTIVLNWL